jgi:hypothetical protein
MAALCSRVGVREAADLKSTSLKANMGHLEACAAAAGLASLLVSRLGVSEVPTNAQLRELNTHVVSLLRSSGGPGTFQMPVELDGFAFRASDETTRNDDDLETVASESGRLSSFGFSGTISHGLFWCGPRQHSASSLFAGSTVFVISDVSDVSVFRTKWWPRNHTACL